MTRLLVGSLLGNLVAILYILEPSGKIVYSLLMAALTYDLQYIWKNKSGSFLLILMFMYGIICNMAIVEMYSISKLVLLQYILIVTTSDVFQYVCGRYVGFTKIDWPSPRKTIEGYILGTVLTVLVVSGVSIIPTMVVARIVIMGVIGDVIESIFKRVLDIKDTSNLLGEHGGWLDRVDGIYLAILVEYILIP